MYVTFTFFTWKLCFIETFILFIESLMNHLFLLIDNFKNIIFMNFFFLVIVI